MIAESLYCVKDFIYLSLHTEYEQSSCLDDNLFSLLFGCFTPLAIRHTSRSDNSLLPSVKRVGRAHPPTKQNFCILFELGLFAALRKVFHEQALLFACMFSLPPWTMLNVVHLVRCSVTSQGAGGEKFLTRPPTLGRESDRGE